MAAKRGGSRKTGGGGAMREALRAARRCNEIGALREHEVVEALRSGAREEAMRAYFGDADYAELRELCGAERGPELKKAPSGPKVLLLPGIGGSNLALKKNGGRDRVWLDPGIVLGGRLGVIALPDAGKALVPDDVVHLAYLKTRGKFERHGFRTEWWAYDWRQPTRALARELAAKLAREPEPVFVVAHSMGGVVARAAIREMGAAARRKVRRLVMLGTPNYGSFAPLMVFRGVFPFLKVLDRWDCVNDAEHLARVFCTIQGLADMLPNPERFSRLGLFDAALWPVGIKPAQAVLALAREAQSLLAGADAGIPMTTVAGFGKATFTSCAVEGGEFVFEQSARGDGTVPLEFAELPGAQMFYAQDGHGELPNNTEVLDAVAAVLKGEAPRLSGRFRIDPPGEWAPGTWHSESALRAGRRAAQRAGPWRPTPEQWRGLVRAAAFSAGGWPSGMGEEPVAGLGTGDGGMAGGGVAGFGGLAPFRDLVVGRARTRRVDLELVSGPIETVRTRACLLGMFQDVGLGESVLSVDAETGGAVREFQQRGMFSRAVGSVFIMPSGRNALGADCLIFAGLGPFDRFDGSVLEAAMENAARTMLRTGIQEFATVAIGSGTRLSVDESIRRIASGILNALRDKPTEAGLRTVSICENDPARFTALREAVYRLAADPLLDGIEMTLRERQSRPVAARAAVGGAAGAGAGAPAQREAHMTVRWKDGAKGVAELEYCLLAPGLSAAIPNVRARFEKRALESLLERIETNAFHFQGLAKFGGDLAGLVLPDDIRTALRRLEGTPLVVAHDRNASRVPWETLWTGAGHTAAEAGLSRRLIADNLAVAKWLGARRADENFDLLLVVNPTEDLEGAEREGARIGKRFPNARVLSGSVASRRRILEEMRSGRYDAMHYAGHAFFDPAHPGRSGLLCAGEEVLTGADLAGLERLPGFVFLNACESGRVRKRGVRLDGRRATRSIQERINRTTAVAEGFLRGGVAGFVGTYWPVGDEAAAEFAETFYSAVKACGNLGAAVLGGRRALVKMRSVDWADYMLFGDPAFVLKTRQPPG